MRRQRSFIAHVVAVALVWAGSVQCVSAAGLIPTDQVARSSAQERSSTSISRDAADAQRSRLAAELVRAGVDSRHAESRLAALTDAEVAELGSRYDTAPVGGLWFTPFLLVALVIGALIGKNERPGASAESDTDLFGRPRSIAAGP